MPRDGRGLWGKWAFCVKVQLPYRMLAESLRSGREDENTGASPGACNALFPGGQSRAKHGSAMQRDCRQGRNTLTTVGCLPPQWTQFLVEIEDQETPSLAIDASGSDQYARRCGYLRAIKKPGFSKPQQRPIHLRQSGILGANRTANSFGPTRSRIEEAVREPICPDENAETSISRLRHRGEEEPARGEDTFIPTCIGEASTTNCKQHAVHMPYEAG